MRGLQVQVVAECALRVQLQHPAPLRHVLPCEVRVDPFPLTPSPVVGTSHQAHLLAEALSLMMCAEPSSLCVVCSWYLNVDLQLWITTPFFVLIGVNYPRCDTDLQQLAHETDEDLRASNTPPTISSAAH